MAEKKAVSISKLSQMIGVSRQSIYNFCDKYGIDAKKIKQEDVERIKEYYLTQEKEKSNNYSNVLKTCAKKRQKASKLSNEEVSTLKERLKNAKEQYNFNQFLIEMYTDEIDSFQNTNGTLAIPCSNGSMSMIPQVKYLESYQKLNMSLNKTIDELETKLNLIEKDEDDFDPFK